MRRGVNFERCFIPLGGHFCTLFYNLKDVLAPYSHEILPSGQTIAQALKKVRSQENETKTISQMDQDLWKNLDLGTQDKVKPFLELAANSFAHGFPEGFRPHKSWLHNKLFFRALEEGISVSTAEFFLNLGLSIDARDAGTMANVFHYAVKKNYSREFLYLLLTYLFPEERIRLLKAKNSEGLTPLDEAMKIDNADNFKNLISFGAMSCSAKIALQFYKTKVKQNPELHQVFLQLMDLNPELEWEVTLEELLPSLRSKANYKGDIITSSFHGKRQFSEEIKNQTLDTKGNWISVTKACNHSVAYAKKKSPLRSLHEPHKAHGLYFKIYPALPGLEEAVGRLTRQLLGFGAPHTDLIKWNNIPILLSQAISGDTLHTILRDQPDRLEELDDESISGMLIMAMLTNPEDGKPENYIVSPHPSKPGKYQIIGLDNDQAFVPAVVREVPKKQYLTGKLRPIAQVKTILYCLNQMKDSIHPQIRTLIINAHPDRYLEEWLRELERVSKQHFGLFDSTEQHQLFEKHDCFIGVPFQQKAITHIYEKFVQLRNLVTEHPHITHIDLLAKLEQRLAKRYQDVLAKDISVEARFNEADRPFYEVKRDSNQQESHTTVTKSGNVLQSMEISLKEAIFDSICSGKKHSPVQALEELERIKTEVQTITLESLAARVGDLDLLKTLTLEEKRTAFLKLLDEQKKRLNLTEQEAVLTYLSIQKNIQELPLPHFSFLRDTLFQRLNLEHLKKLDLRHCAHQSFTNDSLMHLSQKALGLEELNLGYLTQLTAIGDVRVWDIVGTRDAPLIFNALHTLNLSHCINLAKFLMKASKLHYLNIENCSKLTDEILDGVIKHSKDLQKLKVEGCSLIGEKALREKCPNFSLDYLKKVKEKGPILQILKCIGPELTLTTPIDLSEEGKEIFQKAVKLNRDLHFNTTIHIKSNQKENGEVLQLINISFPFLTSLKVSTTQITYCEIENFIKLTSLDLRKTQIKEDKVKILTGFINLNYLNLSNNNLKSSEAQQLATTLTNLTRLNLSNNEVGKEGVEYITKNLTNLTRLNLSNNEVGKKGVEYITKNLTNLTHLNLSNNEVRKEGLEYIAKNLTNLTSLDLSGNFLHDEGVNKIAEGNFSNLRKLKLKHITRTSTIIADGNGYQGPPGIPFSDPSGVKGILIGGNSQLALASLTKLTNLTSLDLAHNNIGDAGAHDLSQGNFSVLTSLDLAHNNIGASGANALAQGNLMGLTSLNLEGNCMTGIAIAKGNFTALTSLNLGGNKTGDIGASALAKGNLTALTSLNLFKSEIGNIGAMNLSQGNFSNLTKLSLGDNNIGDEAQEELRKRYPDAKIKF